MQKQTNEVVNDVEMFCPQSRKAWRVWLQNNHQEKQSVWLVYYKKSSGKPTIAYSDAVDEALCFGWIDSKTKPIDDEKFRQFFTRRKVNSVWSKVNKEKIERLVMERLMAEAGFDSIAKAKQNGTWNILDDAEALIVPADLEYELSKKPNAEAYFSGLSRSDKRNILQWLILAKRAETRQKRINEIVDLADQNQKPKQFR